MQAGRFFLSAAVAAAAAATGTAVLAAVVAHRVIHPQRAKPTQILAVDGDHVVLSSTPLTRTAGVIGLLHDDERHLAVLQPNSPEHVSDGNVRRTLRAPAPAGLRTGPGRAIGNVFGSPEELGQAVHEVALATDLGPAPAWVIGPESGDTWLIHLHGSLSGREGALRSVVAASAAGLPSLVPSFRGDGEGPSTPRGAFTLGQTEWRDIESALDYAVAHGAQRIVILGWSNGASMALRLATSSQHRDAIAGIVAISPVLDWASTIRLGIKTSRLPRAVAAVALWALQHRLTSALLGAPEPLRFAELKWTEPPVPVLLLHSAGDQTTPYSASLRFKDRSPDRVTLPELPTVPHALEWNADPARFAELLTNWLTTLLPTR